MRAPKKRKRVAEATRQNEKPSNIIIAEKVRKVKELSWVEIKSRYLHMK